MSIRINCKQKIGGKISELFIFLFFLASYLAVLLYHEPWFDEAQAWQIARRASFQDILFVIPHYEGHPPLWHLLLSIPAKLGVPYELGLKSVAGMATVASVWLILFRSPFPRFVRLLLPFQYFVFYQYGIVARPYGMMGLVLLLLACNFERRNEKPWLFVLFLGLECLLSAYGIAVSGGIACVWLFEILSEKSWKLLGGGWKDKRFAFLGALLVLALLILLEIRPMPDTIIQFARIGEEMPKCLLYTFLMMLPDSTCLFLIKGEGILRYMTFSGGDIFLGALVGGIMLTAITLRSTRKNRMYFWIPYICLCLFSAVVYLAAQHIGIVFWFVLFWLWISGEDKGEETLGRRVMNGSFVRKSLSVFSPYKKWGRVILLFPLCISASWTLFAGIQDMQYPYDFGRSCAAFLKEHELDQAKVLCCWSGSAGPKDMTQEEWFDRMNCNVMHDAVSILPYFENNFIQNFQEGDPEAGYTMHRVSSPEEQKERLEGWRGQGLPDVIIGEVDLKLLYGAEDAEADYIPVACLVPTVPGMWKHCVNGIWFSGHQHIYVRRELAEELGLEWNCQYM